MRLKYGINELFDYFKTYGYASLRPNSASQKLLLHRKRRTPKILNSSPPACRQAGQAGMFLKINA